MPVDRQQKVPPLPNLLTAAGAPEPRTTRTPGASASRFGGAALLYARFVFLSYPRSTAETRNDVHSLVPISNTGRKMPCSVFGGSWLNNRYRHTIYNGEWRTIAHKRTPIGYSLFELESEPPQSPASRKPQGPLGRPAGLYLQHCRVAENPRGPA